MARLKEAEWKTLSNILHCPPCAASQPQRGCLDPPPGPLRRGCSSSWSGPCLVVSSKSSRSLLVHHLDCPRVTWTMGSSQPGLSGRLDPKLPFTLARASASFLPFLVWMDQAWMGHIQNWDLSNHSVHALTKAVAGVCPTKVLDKCVCFNPFLSLLPTLQQHRASQTQSDWQMIFSEI